MKERFPGVTKIEDLPEVYHEVVERLGFDAAKTIMEMWHGQALYFPNPKPVARNRIIYAEFDGNNIAALAQKYGLCPRYVRNIISAQRKAEKAKRTAARG